MFGTLPGWVRSQTGTGEGPWAKAVNYSAETEQYKYYLIAAFEEADADEAIAQMIASTFAVTNEPRLELTELRG